MRVHVHFLPGQPLPPSGRDFRDPGPPFLRVRRNGVRPAAGACPVHEAVRPPGVRGEGVGSLVFCEVVRPPSRCAFRPGATVCGFGREPVVSKAVLPAVVFQAVRPSTGSSAVRPDVVFQVGRSVRWDVVFQTVRPARPAVVYHQIVRPAVVYHQTFRPVIVCHQTVRPAIVYYQTVRPVRPAIVYRQTVRPAIVVHDVSAVLHSDVHGAGGRDVVQRARGLCAQGDGGPRPELLLPQPPQSAAVRQRPAQRGASSAGCRHGQQSGETMKHVHSNSQVRRVKHVHRRNV